MFADPIGLTYKIISAWGQVVIVTGANIFAWAFWLTVKLINLICVSASVTRTWVLMYFI